jgi:hypothetical protein
MKPIVRWKSIIECVRGDTSVNESKNETYGKERYVGKEFFVFLDYLEFD